MYGTHSVSSTDDRPQVCPEAGFGCEACVSATARQLAQICKGLKGKMISQLFVQIYTEPSCARMHGRFAEAYRNAEGEPVREVEAAGDKTPLRKPVAPGYQRREATPSRPRVIAAVA